MPYIFYLNIKTENSYRISPTSGFDEYLRRWRPLLNVFEQNGNIWRISRGIQVCEKAFTAQQCIESFHCGIGWIEQVKICGLCVQQHLSQ